ncbi:DUF397 domain-containing protein [Streptomyces sp. cg28]|uniref:DUF397 domain-containing protein n=1 Tax=Streptomyces sp. cg28 TaxID=3403457 RepID=UPI003B22050B
MNESLTWFKSSRSSDPGPQNCLECAVLGSGDLTVRDSKIDTHRARISFPATAWNSFVGAVKSGEFDR